MTFDPNGGTLADADKTRSLTTGDTYGTPPVPDYEGLRFRRLVHGTARRHRD